jgi:hypothetical protein
MYSEDNKIDYDLATGNHSDSGSIKIATDARITFCFENVIRASVAINLFTINLCGPPASVALCGQIIQIR